MPKKRVVDFRNRQKSSQAAVTDVSKPKEQSVNDQMVGMLLGLSKRVFDLEKELSSVKSLLPIAKAADYRSLASQRLLEDKEVVTKEEVLAMTNRIVVEDFDLKSAHDDKAKNLEVADDEAAAEGHFAILNMKFFKDGKELVEEEYPRTKINLGAHELFPELDDAVMGMRVGDNKKFDVQLVGETDECLVTLVGLRKQKSIISDESVKEDHQDVRDTDQSKEVR